MKYCGKYSNKIDMSKFDEISILYDRQDDQLISFIQNNINKRIILIITNIDDFYGAQEWEKLNAIKEKYPEFNFAVCFEDIHRFSYIDEKMQECMQKLEIPYFTGFLATNFDELHYLISAGVCEVYLAEDICFDLKRAKEVCRRAGVTIRAFPNVGQSSVKTTPALKKFFIRPEDIEEYEDVIDTLEFWGATDRQGILLKIYQKGLWFGDLKDLILDFDLSFDSRRIVDGFAHIRKSCARKCMKGGSCQACEHYLSISQKLKDKNLIIRYDKKD